MRSIRTRLLVGLLAVVAVTAVVAGTITYRRMLAETSTLFDYQLRQMALSLKNQAALEPPYLVMSQPSGSDYIVQIWNPFGKLTYWASTPGLPLINRVVLGYANLMLGGKRWRVYGLQSADGVVLVAQPWKVREAFATGAAVRAVVPLLLLLLIMAAAVVWIVARGLDPLKRLAMEVQRRDAHSFEPIDWPRLPQEVAPLAQELNRLLARLSETFDKQRAFVADAAHELRSPLTALSLQLQLLDRAPDDTARAEARARLRAAVDRATHLVNQLLTLARSQPESAHVARRRFQLEPSVRDGLADLRMLAAERHVEIDLETEGEPEILGDPDAIRILVRNLVDNAVRYSPQGGKVRVHVRREARDSSRGALLEVEDEGPGIPASERARVFDRFVRRHDAADGGTGLGLAIVKAIADQYDARVSLHDAVPQGLRVVVEFPPPGGEHGSKGQPASPAPERIAASCP